MELNIYQSDIDKVTRDMPDEVKEEFMEIVTGVEFVRNLISPQRQYAKNRPRDDKGRIIVDLANPHILTDMDWFRPAALHYKEHGCYTFLRPNPNPNSEYGKWIREEKRRIWEDYVRPSDGEWVPGYLYWLLNYSPIILTRIREGSKRAERVQDFPEIWEGIYWRYHYMDQAAYGGLYNDFKGGENCSELARRGAGKSYSMASILSHDFVLGVNRESHSNVRAVVTASKKEYLTKDGTINKFLEMADFLAEHTQFPRRRLKDSMQEMVWEMGYKDAELNINRGTHNTVLGVSSEDESKMRGKRAAHILIEEFGSFPKLLEMYNNLLPSVYDGEYAFGQIIAMGTAGDDKSDFAGAQEIIYNPKGYHMYALPNVYDRPSQGRQEFVYFFPGYVNRKGCYNRDGVSDVTKALGEILMKRYMVKHNSSNPMTLLRTISEIPITPAEAVMKTGINLFPVTDLNERLMEMDRDPKILDSVWIVEMVQENDGKISTRPALGQPIRNFPHKDNKIEGAVEIYEHPQTDKVTGNAYSNRYIGGMDPYDDDAADTMSLGSIFILDLWTDRLVAEYTGRPMFADDFYEVGRRLCLYYNARLNYENNKKGLFSYFSRYHCLHLLTDQLDYLRDKQMIKEIGYGNKQKGTCATAPVNALGRSLLRSWLLKSVTVTRKENGQEQEVTVRNLSFICSRALLQELVSYNSVGNFDRISAMGMLMLLREDRMILYKNDFNRDASEKDSGYLGNDPYFERNYRKTE